MSDDNETLTDFLISLGFKIDESQWGRFHDALEAATLKAKLFGDAIEAMATEAIKRVDETSKKFEELYYAQSRIGADTKHIQAFQYAISQLGGSVDGARQALEGLGEKLKYQPGFEAFLNKLGVVTKDAKGNLLQTSDILINIGKRWESIPLPMQKLLDPITALDEKTRRALEQQPELIKRYQEELASLDSAGLGDKAVAEAVKFEQASRELAQRLDDFYSHGPTNLEAHITAAAGAINRYLDEHKDKINEFVDWSTGGNKPPRSGLFGHVRDALEAATGTSGIVSDLSKSEAHFDPRGFEEHLKTAVGEGVKEAEKLWKEGVDGAAKDLRLTKTLAGARVVAVSDADVARAREVAAQLPGASVYEAGEELIAAKDVDAVVVTSWGPTHAAYVIPAIKGGKPVFCEKPLAATEFDCLAIIDAEAQFGRRLVQVGFMRRFDPPYVAMKETIEKGAIGLPLMFHSVHRNASSPAHFKATMALTDTAVHDIDIARFLLEDEPVAISVRAPRGNRRAGGVADPLLALIDMRSGALVTIETSLHIAYGYDIRGEVIGESGTVSLAEQSNVVIKTNGVASGAVPGDWPERFGLAFDAEFRAWLAAAAKGAAAGPSAWDGYVATAAGLAGVKALASGAREPIELRERPALYATG